MKLGEIIRLLSSGSSARRLTHEQTGIEPRGFSIDSRTLRPDELFFAIAGEKFDGHQFVGMALGAGAIGAVVRRGFAESDEGRNLDPGRLIEVDDTLAALQQLAGEVLRNWKGKEVAITGSMGKTTTKEMTAAVLLRAGRVMKTAGNLNNDYGLPLSVLKMESDGARADDFDFAVLEMGMNHRGEIARLSRIAPPHLSIVTVVAPVHLEFFSSVDEIAEAKSEIVSGTRSGGAAVLNADDPRVARMRDLRADLDFRTFGIDNAADVTARDVETRGLDSTNFRLVTPEGEAQCFMAVAGRHNVYNALAAAAAADYFGVAPAEIAGALGEAASPKMRGEVLRFSRGFVVIDDSYNSNPRALAEMVNTVASNREASRRIVVAGEMLELGQSGPELHREAGRQIARAGIDLLVGVRGLARELVAGAHEGGMNETATAFFDSPGEAAEFVEGLVQRGDLVLVKASRGVKAEAVIQRLKQAFELKRGKRRDRRR